MRVVLQKDLTDCGICSLKAIINYYHGDVPLEVLRHDTYTNGGGTDAYHLLEAAKKYGFDGFGTKIDNIDELNSVTLPAIAHTIIDKKFEHFLVIEKIDKNNVYLMDPAKGNIKMTKDAFLKIWTNIILILYPQTIIKKFNKTKPLYEQFWFIIKEQKKLLIYLLIMTLLLTITTIAYSLFFKIIINNLFSIDYIVIKELMFAFGLLLFFKILFNYFENYYEIHLNKNIDAYLKQMFIKQIFFLPSKSIKSRSPGEIITRVNELENYKSLLTDVLVTLILDSIMVIISGIFLFSINKWLFLIAFILILSYFIIAFISNKLTKNHLEKCINSDTIFNNNLIENINNLDSFKHLHIEKLAFNKHEKILTETIYGHYRLLVFLNIINIFKALIHEYGLYFINVFGVYFIFKNKISIIDLITFNSILIYFKDPIKQYIDMLPKISYIKASLERISDFLEIEPEVFDEFKNRLTIGDIKFSNVNYSYNGIKKCLNNINFSIKPKEHIMLKGSSGCGKSTICRLLMRLIDNYEGTITINNVNILDLDLNIIRSNISYLSQNEQLFSDTIYNNIVLNRNITPEKINEILKITELDHFVDHLALRLNTMLIEQGNNLSGGERQRILLARLLLSDRDIIILDEALSEVSEEMEKRIIKNIRKFYADRTIIYVTHRELSNYFKRYIEVK